MKNPFTLADMHSYQDAKKLRHDCRFYGTPLTSVIDLGRCRARKKLRELDCDSPVPHNRPPFSQDLRAELF